MLNGVRRLILDIILTHKAFDFDLCRFKQLNHLFVSLNLHLLTNIHSMIITISIEIGKRSR